MRTIIIGMGEIGQALFKVLTQQYVCYEHDPLKGKECEDKPFGIMHVCFPYNKDFIKQVQKYKNMYKPTYTVIHSTVPIGTSSKLDSIDSPVIGVHPHLEESLKTFTKFLGGKDADKVAEYFRRAGIKVYITDKSETTELMKIMDTTFSGLCVEYTKEVKKICDKLNVPFEMWTLWTNNYNQGYSKLGYPEFSRPNLIPIMKKIGGHCILPNLEFVNNDFTKLIKQRNEK